MARTEKRDDQPTGSDGTRRITTDEAHNEPRRASGKRPRPTSLVVDILALLVIVAAIVVLVLLGDPKGLVAKTKSAPAPAPADAATTTETVIEEEPAIEVSVDPRDSDFIVDSTRTDWNFEPTEGKCVWLTFDDGPSENTAEVLDILDDYGIKATFFVTGINPSYFPMIAEAYHRGHTIGLHTYSHIYEDVYSSTTAYWDDLQEIAEVVRGQIGYVPCFIRFPGGSSNTISSDYTPGIMGELVDQVTTAGYQYYDWDASCGDGADHSAEELVEATKADTSWEPTDIVFLMHDGAGKHTTVEALPQIIEYFRSAGYEFAAIDRATPVSHHLIGY